MVTFPQAKARLDFCSIFQRRAPAETRILFTVRYPLRIIPPPSWVLWGESSKTRVSPSPRVYPNWAKSLNPRPDPSAPPWCGLAPGRLTSASLTSSRVNSGQAAGRTGVRRDQRHSTQSWHLGGMPRLEGPQCPLPGRPRRGPGWHNQCPEKGWTCRVQRTRERGAREPGCPLFT